MSESEQKTDGRDWARKIMTRIEYGQKVSSYAQRCARQALGLPEPLSQHRSHFDTNGRVLRDAAPDALGF